VDVEAAERNARDDVAVGVRAALVVIEINAPSKQRHRPLPGAASVAEHIVNVVVTDNLPAIVPVAAVVVAGGVFRH